MSVYVLVNISNNKITFIEFACFGDKCFVVPPRIQLDLRGCFEAGEREGKGEEGREKESCT